ncbi:MAG TPA: Xaa-Pro dipeptidase [Steroidobacteraceae bacterium]|nr:Xaa-Pro dipeptidase [Steroidobacteraceae bacterium]
MTHLAPAELYADHLAEIADRTAQALAATGYDALVLHSGGLRMVEFDDYPYPYKAHAAFKLWAPLTDTPDCFVVYRPGERPQLLFNRPDDYWHKATALPDAYWAREFELEPVSTLEAARQALRLEGRTAFIGDVHGFADWGFAAVNPAPLVTRLDHARARKTPYEIACLAAANALGARAHRAAEQAFRAGESEYGIALAFMQSISVREQELPYNPIVALNAGGAVLHYQVLERAPPAERLSLLIDAGAVHAGYASDITRTYSYADADFAALVARMDEAQLALCAGVKAGVDWRDLHLTAHRLIAEVLHDAGIITVDAEVAVETGLSGVFLPHGLGHLLGLQVHDVGGTLASPEGGTIPRPPGHPYLRLTRVLEQGFVVTMEPGLYFIDSLLAAAKAGPHGRHIDWTRVAQFAPFGGIRIEDNLAVTAAGCDNLTRDAFASLG